MTYLADLSESAFLTRHVPAGVRVLAVGWLDRDHEFPRGPVPEGFLDALFAACRDHETEVTRGLHLCPFCPIPDEMWPPITAERGGDAVTLGHAEVRFLGNQADTWLAAPTLIFHYVEAHAYRPPHEFIEAVSAMRLAPTPEQQ
jgi:hypothetical protein